MANGMSISHLAVPPGFEPIEPIGRVGGMDKAKGTSFADTLSNSIEEVDGLMKTAERKEVELATGSSENLHEALIAVEKAETAMKLMIQLRNKALDAYQEVLRMPL